MTAVLGTSPAMTQRDRICAACGESDSIECCTPCAIALPRICAEQGILARGDCSVAGSFSSGSPRPPVLTDEEGLIAFLRDDFMGGAEEAASAVDAFLHAIASFGKLCMEQCGGWFTPDSACQQYMLSKRLHCMLILRSCVAAPKKKILSRSEPRRHPREGVGLLWGWSMGVLLLSK